MARRLWLIAPLVLAASSIQLLSQSPRLAPFVATPHDVVDRMLQIAGTGPDDVVYDLGSGDGRIVIAAAQKFGARGVGIDIDPGLVEKARANARAAGVESRVTFRVQDVLTADVSPASVVTLFLLASSNVRLRPMLNAQLRPGARIVAHNYPIGDWEPALVDNFTDAAGSKRTIYLWRK